jgi:hypothetical protein
MSCFTVNVEYAKKCKEVEHLNVFKRMSLLPEKNGIKYITTPFLCGLCYGPVHVGVYDPWIFVGLVY